MNAPVLNTSKGRLARRRILDYLAEHPDGATNRVLAEVTGLAVSTVHFHIRKLVEAGLLIHRKHKGRVFAANGADTLEKVLLLLESCIGVFDEATRWADAYPGVDSLREAAEVLSMIIAKEQLHERITA